MGLYLLNISVDTADPNPEHIPEDLTINDQESIVEIIVEQVLGFEDAIKEYDDHDPEDHNKKKGVSIDLLALFHSTADTAHHQLFEQQKRSHNYVARLAKGYHQIDSPPPKV